MQPHNMCLLIAVMDNEGLLIQLCCTNEALTLAPAKQELYAAWTLLQVHILFIGQGHEPSLMNVLHSAGSLLCQGFSIPTSQPLFSRRQTSQKLQTMSWHGGALHAAGQGAEQGCSS